MTAVYIATAIVLWLGPSAVILGLIVRLTG